ncbi:beta-lactamase family protein [Hypoxylon sp. NC1633]|nr:beta-lactamase family protein [Hypoxylon sp. NC1633]
MPFSRNAARELRSIMEQSVVAGKEAEASAIPGTTFVVVDRYGEELFAHSAGKRGLRSRDPMTLDSVFWMASCTQMVTALASMQLVERGELNLDDAAQVEYLCPELKAIKVLRDDGTFEEKKRGITLRMLLTHTAGFKYSIFDETLRDWSHPIGIDEFSSDIRDILKTPLRSQPGEAWSYGIDLDWAGILIERRTGMSLNDYFQKNICQPLGLENVNMHPTQAMKDNLASLHQRELNGTLTPRDHLLRRPLVTPSPSEGEATDMLFYSGGIGLFANPQEHIRILGVLLNDGTCPRTGAKILSKATVDEMFTNQIPQFPQHGRQRLASAKPHLANPVADFYPIPGDPPQGWGLTFMLSGANPLTGRSDKTAWWAGLPNVYWWCDRGHGVAGLVCAQIVPLLDSGVIGLWTKLETAVYKHMALAKRQTWEPARETDLVENMARL